MHAQVCCATSFTLLLAAGAAAQPTATGPDTIDLLMEEQTQAQACVNQLKNSGDARAIGEGRTTYDAARAAANGAIAGLVTALVQGYKPEELPRIQANLGRAGAGVQEICNDAIRAAAAAGGSKGLVDETVKAAVEPVFDLIKAAAEALWSHHLEMDKLETETIKGQLEAAKWPQV